MDTKIAPKALAKRLEHIHPDLIHYNQCESSIDPWSVWTTEDVLEYTKQRGQSGIMVTIDFEKAFDSLDHEFSLKVLHTFNFELSFTQ